jgi:hypothetical protein
MYPDNCSNCELVVLEVVFWAAHSLVSHSFTQSIDALAPLLQRRR